MLKKFTISILAIGFFSVLYINLTAFPDGISGTTKRPGSSQGDPGCICHNETVPTPGVTVKFDGPTSVRASDTATFKLKITGGPDSAAGCDIAAYYGKLLLSSADTSLQYREETYYFGQPNQLIKNELTHRYPKLPSNDTITFTFKYIAPGTANIVDTLYANGNSVILDGDPHDDLWNFAPNRPIIITTTGINDPSSVVKNFNLEQNFPNPFNPSTRIDFTLDKAAMVTLKVFDISGKEITSLINNKNYSIGSYTVNFDAAKFNLNSGVYFYKLEANGFGEVKKMMLVK
jgi:hypothetical protein